MFEVQEAGKLHFFPEIKAAFDFLRGQEIVGSDEFQKLTDAASRNAFSIAGIESKRALEGASELLQQAIAEGWSQARYREAIDQKFADLGLDRLSDFQVTRTFRTNISAARSEAHDRTMAKPIIAQVFRFDRYDAIVDARSDPTHRVLDNWVFLHSDPVWSEGGQQPMRPPRRPNCRCSRTALSVRQFLALYRSGSIRYGSESITVADPETGKPVHVRRNPRTNVVLREARVR